jgi:hypothetical protein
MLSCAPALFATVRPTMARAAAGATGRSMIPRPPTRYQHLNPFIPKRQIGLPYVGAMFPNRVLFSTMRESLKVGKYSMVSNLTPRTFLWEFPSSIRTLIVADATSTKPRCCTARIIKADSDRWSEEKLNLKLLHSARLISGPADHVLVPVDSFQWADQEGEYHCLIYDELLGSDMDYMTSDGGPENLLLPANMIRKIALQTLEAISFMHGRGITCGNKSNS